MARVTGPTVDDRGDYRAIEVMAHHLVRLEKVGFQVQWNGKPV
jgi:hypothetical protein